MAESRDVIEVDLDILIAELSAYSEGLQSLLDEQLIKCLKTGKEVSLLAKLCFKLNKLSIFESAFRFVFVDEALAQVAQASVQPDSATFFDFSLFLTKTLESTTTLISTWKDLIAELYPKSQFKFNVRAILGPTLAWMTTNLSSIFIPSANLAEFKTNFDAALSFVSSMESQYFEFEDEVAYFRAHSAWTSFMKKWPLHQYFQLQIKQLFQPVEAAFLKPAEITSEPKTLEQTILAINALKQLWSPTHVITPLVPKNLKVTLQLIRRFIQYSSDPPSAFTNSEKYCLCVLIKRHNLVQFKRLFKESICGLFKTGLDRIEEGLAEQLLEETINKELEQAISVIDSNILNGIEQIFDHNLNSIKSLETLSFKPFLLLKHSKFNIRLESEAILGSLQKTLIKINRIVLKLLDEHQNLSFFPAKMEQLESEAAELGRSSLKDEEFWIEIKQELSKK